jgi:hypothetical protein
MVGLIDSTGNTQFVPLEWTDRNPPSRTRNAELILNVRSLLSLAQWIGQTTTVPGKGLT